jgi:hypothetical protein
MRREQRNFEERGENSEARHVSLKTENSRHTTREERGR